MSATEIVEAIRKLPLTEQREVVERLRVEFAVNEDPLTPAQIAELDHHIENLLHPNDDDIDRLDGTPGINRRAKASALGLIDRFIPSAGR